MEPLFYPKGDSIFVTGATGLLGAQFIRKLLGQGYRVVALRRKEVPDPWLKEVDDQIEWRLGDINDIQSLLEGMKGCQHVIHAAAMISFLPKRRQQMMENECPVIPKRIPCSKRTPPMTRQNTRSLFNEPKTSQLLFLERLHQERLLCFTRFAGNSLG